MWTRTSDDWAVELDSQVKRRWRTLLVKLKVWCHFLVVWPSTILKLTVCKFLIKISPFRGGPPGDIVSGSGYVSLIGCYCFEVCATLLQKSLSVHVNQTSHTNYVLTPSWSALSGSQSLYLGCNVLKVQSGCSYSFKLDHKICSGYKNMFVRLQPETSRNISRVNKPADPENDILCTAAHETSVEYYCWHVLNVQSKTSKM